MVSSGIGREVQEDIRSRHDLDKTPLLSEVSYTGVTVSKGFFPRCNIVMEVLMIIFMLCNYPLRYLLPEYIQRREFESLTGNIYNKTKDRNICLSTNHTSFNDPFSGNLSLASSAASYFDLEMSLVSYAPALVMVMFLGPFSDRAGRRVVLLPPIIGQMVAAGMCTATAFFHLPIQVILVGYFIYGCCGLNICFYLACVSYQADISTTEQRSFRIVIGTLCMDMSAITSTVGTGYLADMTGFSWVFFIVFVISFLAILYAVFLVPETIQRDPEVKFLTLSYLKKSFTVVLVDDSTRRRWKLLTVLGVLFVGMLLAGSTASIETLFTMGRPLCWTATLVGVYNSTKRSTQVVGSGLTMLTLKSYVKDSWLGILAGISIMSACILRFFVTTTAMMFGAAVIEFGAPFFTSSIRSMLTKLVKPDEIGAILTGVAVIELVCELLSHVITNPLYSISELSGHPSTIFLYIAAGFFIYTVIMIVYAILTRHTKSIIKNNGDVTS